MVAISAVTMLLLAIFFASMLAIADKKLRVEEDPMIEKVNELLPQANCAACGFASCHNFAEALATGETDDPTLCRVASQEEVDELGCLLGIEVGKKLDVKARILCGGGDKEARVKGVYAGVEDCVAASLLGGGQKVCGYGCLSFGTCVRACPFDAMFMDDNGLPRIIDEKCTGCGICVKHCPKNIIDLLAPTQEYYVKCSSQDKGGVSKKACDVSCIGCQKCVKECESDAIIFENNLAKIDTEKCTNMGKCFEVCPTKCIIETNKLEKIGKGVA